MDMVVHRKVTLPIIRKPKHFTLNGIISSFLLKFNNELTNFGSLNSFLKPIYRKEFGKNNYLTQHICSHIFHPIVSTSLHKSHYVCEWKFEFSGWIHPLTATSNQTQPSLVIKFYNVEICSKQDLCTTWCTIFYYSRGDKIPFMCVCVFPPNLIMWS